MRQQRKSISEDLRDKHLIAIEIEKFLLDHNNLKSLINLTIVRENDGFEVEGFEKFSIDESSIVKIDGDEIMFRFQGTGDVRYNEPASKIKTIKSVNFGGVAQIEAAYTHGRMYVSALQITALS